MAAQDLDTNVPRVHEPPSGCHLDCRDCGAQYLSSAIQRSHKCVYATSYTNAMAAARIEETLSEINTHRTTLHQVLKTHGDLILARWSTAELDRRPNDGTWLLRRSGKTFAGATWLDIQLLAEDRMKLLSLLHLRSTYPASAWALTDTKDSMPFFGRPGPYDCDTIFNAQCVSMVGEKYGEMADWDEAMTHSWAYAGFPRAFMTIGLQLKIMSFLVEVTTNIVAGAVGTDSQRWSRLIVDGFKASGSESLWSSYASPAFAPPAFRGGFDARALLQKAQARLDLCLDDIWLMQTDPLFMLYTLQHRKATLEHDEAACACHCARWEHIAVYFVMDVVHRLNAWHNLVRVCKKAVVAMEDVNDSVVCPGTVLTPSVERALHELGTEIEPRLHVQVWLFDRLLPSMGPMKARFEARRALGISRRTGPLPISMELMGDGDILTNLIYQIQAGAIHGSMHLPMWFNALETELLNQKGPCSRADKQMIDQLSDITAMDEIRQAWLFNQLGHNIRKLTNRTRQEREDAALRPSGGVALSFSRDWILRFGFHLQYFSEAPFPKGRKSLEWLKDATESRSRLAEFWDAVREGFVVAQRAAGCDISQSALGTFDFDMEPGYWLALDRERSECEEASRLADAATADATIKLDRLAMAEDWSGDSEGAKPIWRKQTAAKASRAIEALEANSPARSMPASCDGVSNEAQPAIEQVPIDVTRDSLSVFHKMYPSEGVQCGGVRWSYFVQAMTDAGMTATAGGGGGSSVSFCNGAGTIVFHRPHPDPFIDSIMLRAMGKRMNRRFRWCREQFVLRPKMV
ncbi:hypothetical protein LTR10_010708 [Elasticomyces elasticus]|nr:hypothetical protein LTR10_010708 [Elasticomyces elasticus]KAK4968314.1 hypothetical protein LTR42_009597 [Elasticomyces elasticus]